MSAGYQLVWPGGLNENCARCPRLVESRSSVQPVARHANKPYANKPVPDMGDLNGWLLVVGMAPGAHGANRTGRPFTGDKAGDLLYAVLHHRGFCSSAGPESIPPIHLTGVMISNAARCVPPKNNLQRREVANCREYLAATIASMPNLTDILCIGGDAFNQVRAILDLGRQPRFGHGLSYEKDGLRINASYHTSGYMQSTKQIDFEKFDRVVGKILQRRTGNP